METARTRRESVPADEHLDDMHALQGIFGAALDNIDSTPAGDIAGLNDAAAIQARLARATNSVRQAVADSITEYAATVETDS